MQQGNEYRVGRCKPARYYRGGVYQIHQSSKHTSRKSTCIRHAAAAADYHDDDHDDDNDDHDYDRVNVLMYLCSFPSLPCVCSFLFPAPPRKSHARANVRFSFFLVFYFLSYFFFPLPARLVVLGRGQPTGFSPRADNHHCYGPSRRKRRGASSDDSSSSSRNRNSSSSSGGSSSKNSGSSSSSSKNSSSGSSGKGKAERTVTSIGAGVATPAEVATSGRRGEAEPRLMGNRHPPPLVQ